MWYCINCSFKTEYYSSLLKHYTSHKLIENIPCVICSKIFVNVRRLKYHLKLYHLHFYNLNCSIRNNVADSSNSNLILNINDNLSNDENIESVNQYNLESNENSVLNCSVPEHNDTDINNLEINTPNNKFAKYLVHSRYINKISLSTIIKTSSEVANILEANNKTLLTRVINSLPSEYSTTIKDIFNTQYLDLIDPLKSISNSYAFNRYISQHFIFIIPTEIIIGRINNKLHVYHYISILDSLKQFIKHDDVIDDIFRDNIDDGIIRDFHDGQNFKNNPLFSKTKTTLQLQLYYDEFTCTNPLNNTNREYKIGACYYILGNLHSKYKSTLDNIQLVFLVKFKYIKKYGFYTIFEPLIKDIKSLETNGITITHNDKIINLLGTISFISSDNLAAHALGGYIENFSIGRRRCRTCMASNEELSTIFNSNYFILRSKDGYNNQIANIIRYPELSSDYGLKYDSIFNSLKYFHFTTGLPHDISHDIFEGVASETLSNILTKLISDKLITLEYINIKIRNFPYIGNDKKDKPIELRIVKSKIKICYKQAQMWCFIRLLPLMLGDKIPIENDTWELLLKFVNLVESVCAYSFSDSDLSYLDFKIEAFNSHFCKNFPSISVKPKRHYIIHIPKMIRDYGPVIHTWTIRFEA